MSGSRFLAPTSPGGLLSIVSGLLTSNETLVVQALTNKTYFYLNETPTGTIDGSNKTFTLAHTPNPSNYVDLFLNGQKLAPGGTDYTISGATLTLVTAPPAGSVILADYIVSPV